MTRNFLKIELFKKTDVDYLRGLRRMIVFSSLLFLSSAVYGFFFIFLHPESSQRFLEVFTELSRKIIDLKQHELTILIFFNNGFKIAILIFLGILLGIAPIIFLTANGFLLGVVAFMTQSESGWAIFLKAILPHGIFEIPVLIIAGAMGLELGKAFIKFLNGEGVLIAESKLAFSFFARILLPLLLFAAFVEVFITKTMIISG